MRTIITSALLGVLVPCAVFAAAPAEDDALRGRWLNAAPLDGRWLNSANLEGGIIQGTALRGLEKEGSTIHRPRLEGAEIVGETVDWGCLESPTGVEEPCLIRDGVPYRMRRGEWLEGATLEATAGAMIWTSVPVCDGYHTASASPGKVTTAVVTLKIADVTWEDDLPLYTIFVESSREQRLSGQVGPEEKRRPLCGLQAASDAKGAPLPVKAIALQGTWNPFRGPTGGAKVSDSGVTFACVNGALGKCAYNGYRPWVEDDYAVVTDDSGATLLLRVPGRSLHQACTRMVRADYCGNGESHTVDHTPVGVFDRYNLLATSPSGMAWEALWDDGGALVLSCPRYQQLTIDPSNCPSLQRLPMSCGDPGLPELRPGLRSVPLLDGSPWIVDGVSGRLAGLIQNYSLPLCSASGTTVK